MRWMLAVTVVALAGCATSGGVSKLGPETYVVSSQVMFGPSKGAAAREAALKEAAQFCEQHSREILVDDYTSTGGANTLTGDAEVRFRCLAKDDPALRAPMYPPTNKLLIDEKHR